MHQLEEKIGETERTKIKREGERIKEERIARKIKVQQKATSVSVEIEDEIRKSLKKGQTDVSNVNKFTKE